MKNLKTSLGYKLFTLKRYFRNLWEEIESHSEDVRDRYNDREDISSSSPHRGYYVHSERKSK